MASRDAAIRVSLRSSAFKSDTRSMESHVKTLGKRMGSALKTHLSAGLDAAKKSIAEIGNGIKNTIRMAATLGGAISVGGAVKTAMEAETAYLQLGDALTTFSKNTWEAADAQAMVEKVADKTKIPIEDLHSTLMQLASVSGKVDIGSTLERASEQARRLAMEGEFIGRVYTRMIAKGVADSAIEAENLTEQFNTLFRQMLGVDLDEAIDPMDVAELAAFINTTGNEASEMLRLLSLGGDKIAKDFGQANMIVEELGLLLHQTKGVDEMTKKLKLPKGAIDANKTALENMLTIADLGPKKFKEMADALGGDKAGEGIKQIIGVEYFEKEVSKKVWDLRIAEVKKQLKDLGDLAVDRTRIEEADQRHRQTIQAKINGAMNELAKSFADPKMQNAISELANNLPRLAEIVADVTSFIAENPKTAVGLAVGGNIAASAFAGVAGSAMPAILKGLFGFGGGKAAASAAGDALSSMTKEAAKTGIVWRGLAKAGKGAFDGLVKLGAPEAGFANVYGKAGYAAAGLAAAGAAGYELGDIIWKFIGKPAQKADQEMLDKADTIEINRRAELRRAKTIEEKFVVLEETKKDREKIDKQYVSVWSEIPSWFTGEPAATEKLNEKERALTVVQTEVEMAIRDQMAAQLKSSGKYNETWDDMIYNMERLNVVMKKFEETMAKVRPPNMTPTKNVWSPEAMNRNRSSSRGTSRPSNADNKPGAEPKRG